MQRNSRPENRLGSSQLAKRVPSIYVCVLVGGRCSELYSAFHVKQIHMGALQTRLTLPSEGIVRIRPSKHPAERPRRLDMANAQHLLHARDRSDSMGEVVEVLGQATPQQTASQKLHFSSIASNPTRGPCHMSNLG